MSTQNFLDDCTIWQACRATSAALTFFPSAIFSSSGAEYVDGAMGGFNNPIRPLIDEARDIWGSDAPIGCIISIGTGMPELGDVKKGVKIIQTLKDMALQTEYTAKEVKRDMLDRYGITQKVYHRFNVAHGLEKVGLEEWTDFGRVESATQSYLKDMKIDIDTCATQLENPVVLNTTATTAPKTGVFTVPFPQDADFVGRKQILSDIETRLAATSRIALSGIGGVGKSQIAIEFAHRFRKIKPQYHVLWVYAASAAKFNQSYQEIAKKLAMPGWNTPLPLQITTNLQLPPKIISKG